MGVNRPDMSHTADIHYFHMRTNNVPMLRATDGRKSSRHRQHTIRSSPRARQAAGVSADGETAEIGAGFAARSTGASGKQPRRAKLANPGCAGIRETS